VGPSAAFGGSIAFGFVMQTFAAIEWLLTVGPKA